jgi:hypothetical protein
MAVVPMPKAGLDAVMAMVCVGPPLLPRLPRCGSVMTEMTPALREVLSRLGDWTRLLLPLILAEFVPASLMALEARS